LVDDIDQLREVMNEQTNTRQVIQKHINEIKGILIAKTPLSPLA
jgi:hypothetical protein